MKDSEGREYDGWVLKNRRGSLLTWTFCKTRTQVRGEWPYAHLENLEVVKVRIVEVET